MPRVLPALVLLAVASASPAASPDPKSLAVPAEDAARARELVKKLASDVYTEREDATRQLRAMGRKALPALEAGADDPDPEVRLRCEILLPAAEADDFDARLATFQADKDSKFDHDLPGWNQFHKLVGKTEAGRVMFSDLLKQPENRDLIAGMAQDAAELTRRFDARKQDLYAKMFPRATVVDGKVARYEPTVRDATLFLFVETVLGDKAGNARLGPVSVYYILSRPGVRTAIDSDKHAEAIRQLAGAWAESRTDPTNLSRAMYVVGNLKLKEGLGLAGKIIKLEGATVHLKIAAAAAVAKTGTAEHLPLLKPLFENDAVLLGKVGAANEIRVQDAALALAVLLTGQQPADYGFKVDKIPRAAESKFVYYNYWFESAEARKAAFAKFAEWEDKNRPAEKK
jgi:hypothetical protein